jgi:hypothetical protein
VDIAIAAPPVAKRPAGNSGDALIHGTNKARKAGSIIATGNGSIGVDAFKNEPA